MNFFHQLSLFTLMLVGSARAVRIGMFQKYQVQMMNNIVNNTEELVVHCKSADDDLGEHYLDSGDDWEWEFRVNFFRSTLFLCDLKWGEMEKSFAAFDTDSISVECEETSRCFWSMREEGIYFSCDDKNYVKTHTWPR